MTLSKRKLTKWRKGALKVVNSKPVEGTIDATITHLGRIALADCILLLTQELLDLHLLKEIDKDG